MQIIIDHRTRYHFSEPQSRVVQLLRMTPQDTATQTVTDWSITVDCDARMRQGQDGYGNITTMLYIDGPVERVELLVQGEVLTDESRALVTGAPETLPPLFFLRPTASTAADEGMKLLAATLTRSVADPVEKAKLLTVHLFERIKPHIGRTPKSRTAVQTLVEGWGSSRDKAQLLIALARSCGMPARFVSGHSLDGINAGDHKSAHCWVEIHAEDVGWLAFDPSTGLNPGETSVRVAIGLDAGDATPLSGTRRGGGIEQMDVDVRVERGPSAAQ